MNKTDFAGLLCSRLCHDLVSPVGAINNGIELLVDENNADMQEQIIELIQQSARQTSNKLQFFRLSFGLGGGFGMSISIDEARRALTGVFDPDKVQMDWQTTVNALPKEWMKIILNMALVAGEAIIGNGSLTLSIDNEDETRLRATITAEGQRLILQDSQRSALVEDIDLLEADPKSIPLAMARLIAQQEGLTLDLDESVEQQIKFTVSK